MNENMANVVVELTEEANWTNAVHQGVETKMLPPGTKLRLVSWRPEGYMAKVETEDGNGEYFFLSHKHITSAKRHE